MGAHPYWYVVDYEPDIGAALEKLRTREFQAGRYNPVIDFPQFPITADSPAPGPEHDSIEEALEASEEDGTRSILDVFAVAEEPDFGCVAPFDEETLIEMFETSKPTREIVEENDEYFDHLDRGMGRYITLYRNNAPSEILFAGYSFD